MMTLPLWTEATTLLTFFVFLQGNVKFNSGQSICFSKFTIARKRTVGAEGSV